MAAIQTVPQRSEDSNFLPIVPRNGVITLYGYGIFVRVERGHLTLREGLADEQRSGRFPRVGHGIKRLIVVGNDGTVSLSALRWLSDQKACFVMLDRNGKVLVSTGPAHSSDVHLRRAQAMAHDSGAATQITKELITAKLAAQAAVIGKYFNNREIRERIVRFQQKAESASTIQSIRKCESLGARHYWSEWRNLRISFPRVELARVPEHWQRFGTRESLLTSSPRLATNPANAILNYLYAILEAEARLAAATLGLDPAMGVLHVDTDSRDSLACDLMEPVRPLVDAYLLDWITKSPFNREWFFEERNGNCRIMTDLARRLSETALTWARAVAPFAERAAQILWSVATKSNGTATPPTRLTQARRRNAKGWIVVASERTTAPENACRSCGQSVKAGNRYCLRCGRQAVTERFPEAAILGRVASKSPAALAKLSATQKAQQAARRNWNSSQQPAWLTRECFMIEVQSKLKGVATSKIAAALSVCLPYASHVRVGRRVPHERHWVALANLVGVQIRR